ncbi:hypothetical protein TNCV_4834621 [Trichonephila clavipes]|nr:hypothetical protein TNCV_4834621 [Trichonephila clavipes]
MQASKKEQQEMVLERRCLSVICNVIMRRNTAFCRKLSVMTKHGVTILIPKASIRASSGRVRLHLQRNQRPCTPFLLSDDAHFWSNGYVNKQNCCIWSEANPQVYVETPLHPEKLTVWCALWAGGILLQKR